MTQNICPKDCSLTFDTNIKPSDLVAKLAREVGCKIAWVSVSSRESLKCDFYAELAEEGTVPELALWDESTWDDAEWADEADSMILENIIKVISNGNLPNHNQPLSRAQHRQLRDAMILEAHHRHKRDIFITRDEKSFIAHGRREKLESITSSKILLEIELNTLLSKHQR